jgi:hypothetical protein
MRGCAKTGCEEPASASVGLRYGERVVVVGDLTMRLDPNLLELCEAHAEALILPRGWVAEDRRRPTAPGPSADPPAGSLPAASEALAPGT